MTSSRFIFLSVISNENLVEVCYIFAMSIYQYCGPGFRSILANQREDNIEMYIELWSVIAVYHQFTLGITDLI